MSRELSTDHPHAYRVVEQHGSANAYTRYHGPYATLAAAKGKRTTIVNQHKRYESGKMFCRIERTTGTWEEVEA